MPEQVRSVHPFMCVLRTHPVIPAHSHEGVAEAGNFVNEGKQYRPGTSLHVKTGRLQGPQSTKKGCKILVLGTAPAATQEANRVGPADQFAQSGYSKRAG
jgi:hypothetical protein